jgi:hypothetical protein
LQVSRADADGHERCAKNRDTHDVSGGGPGCEYELAQNGIVTDGIAEKGAEQGSLLGADYHPGFQQIASADTESGEYQERRLEHPEEAEKFYRALGAQAACVGFGMEASGHRRWFERMLCELKFETPGFIG